MRRTTAMWIFLALALAILPVLAVGQDSAQAKDPAPTSQAGPTYVIGPDDTLYISVWKEPDLTETLPVRADGKISMPLLNDVHFSDDIHCLPFSGYCTTLHVQKFPDVFAGDGEQRIRSCPEVGDGRGVVHREA